jgi:L-rhamnose 1-dehydrogenase
MSVSASDHPNGGALLHGKRMLVTGASAGIGRAIALTAARHGAAVTLNYFGDSTGADSAVTEITANGGRAVAVEGDVADPLIASKSVDACVGAFGALDILVSNAGICPFHSLLDIPVETVRRTVDVNLLGSYYMVQAAARQMVAQGNGGSIIAISSISALVGGAMQTHYTPTKAGVHSLMQSAATALGVYGIRCNSVMPGTIETDINREDLSDSAKRAYMEGRIPLGRLGAPDDIADPVIFLASDMARYVSGAHLLVDGGAFANFQ